MEKKKEERQSLKRILLIVILVLSIVGLSLSAYKFYNYSYALDSNVGTATWYLDYDYTLDGSNIVITKYNGSASDVVISKNATIDGVTYQTVIEGEVFKKNTNIMNVTFEKGVKAGTSLNGLFHTCSNLKTVTFNNFDTSSTTNMAGMFRNCYSLTTLDLSMFDTTNVTTMEAMFDGSGIENLDISSFDTTNTTNMDAMWHGAKKITIGPKMNFKTLEENSGGSFGRGMWQNKSGTILPAIEIAMSTATKSMAGTWTKVSNFIPEMNANFSVQYKIDNYESYTYSVTNNDIKVVNNRIYIENLNKADEDDYKVSGSVTLHFNDAVVDANNTKYDLKLTIDNIHLYDMNVDAKDDNNNQYTNFTHLLLRIYDTYLSAQSNTYMDSTFKEAIYKDVASSYDFTLEILDKSGNNVDGSFVFSAFDIDTTSRKDGNASAQGYGQYSEGINLLEGYDMPTLKMANHTFLRQIGTNRITGSHNDYSSELSEFIIKASATKFKFAWTGETCGSKILSQYQPEIVNIEKHDENGNKLAGAKLKLYYGDGSSEDQLVDSEWTTTTSAKKFFLMPGYYTLKEVSAPNGYKVLSEIHFTVGDGITQNGNSVEKIVMTNVPQQYSYVIIHVDKNNPDIILKTEGASADYNSKIEVKEKDFEGYKYDSKDKEQIIIQTDTSKNIAYVYYVKPRGEVVAEYRDIDTDEKLTDDENYDGPVGDPYETESKDIDGYELVEVKGDETGEYTDEQQKVIYYYRRIKGHSPQTGDTRDIWTWIGLGTISIIGIITVIVFMLRKSKNEEKE